MCVSGEIFRETLLKSYVWSITSYDRETWTIGKTEEKDSLRFGTWCYRKILRISWTKPITNEEVNRRVQKQEAFSKF